MPVQIDQSLRSEILNLFRYVRRLREEIAGVARRRDGHTEFEGMSDQLDAIVGSTADATNAILGGAEAIDAVVKDLREHPDAARIDELCDRITENTTQVLQACGFQDLTGQRISKIIRSIKFIEERVESMTEICGKDEIDDLASEMPGEDLTRDGVALEGPQLPGQAISQDEIDKLFG